MSWWPKVGRWVSVHTSWFRVEQVLPTAPHRLPRHNPSWAHAADPPPTAKSWGDELQQRLSGS